MLIGMDFDNPVAAVSFCAGAGPRTPLGESKVGSVKALIIAIDRYRHKHAHVLVHVVDRRDDDKLGE